jgi:3-oxoacyl-[acyl-carrier-protein] synthase III
MSSFPRPEIAAVEYYLPADIVTNEALAREFPEWSVEKIAEKTGIHTRHLAAADQCSSDLACEAARKLFSKGTVRAEEIDFVLFCTQTPDFALPTSACLLQHRLGIPTTAGALDFNLGCSGYIYGLAMAKGLIETGQARKVLFLTGETYSKLLDPSDKTVRTVFGDAGAATLVGVSERTDEMIGRATFGTDGSGGMNLVAPQGGFRGANAEAAGRAALWMNGPEIFNFTLRTVPAAVQRTLDSAKLALNDIDLFIFHQANQFMLEHLRKKMGLTPERFFVAIAHSGNTVSNTIPIALKEAESGGRLTSGMRIMLVGFGVGYSWAAVLIRWP